MSCQHFSISCECENTQLPFGPEALAALAYAEPLWACYLCLPCDPAEPGQEAAG